MIAPYYPNDPSRMGSNGDDANGKQSRTRHLRSKGSEVFRLYYAKIHVTLVSLWFVCGLLWLIGDFITPAYLWFLLTFLIPYLYLIGFFGNSIQSPTPPNRE